MDAMSAPTTKKGTRTSGDVITLPVAELPTRWYNVLPDLPAPESAHAVAAVVRKAAELREEGREATILFSLSGHGLFDLGAYEAYLDGRLADQGDQSEAIAAALTRLPGGATMIVILEPDLGGQEAAIAAVRAVAARYPGVAVKPYEFRGTTHRFAEVHLLGLTAAVPTDAFEALPGVRQVVRVSAKYRLIGRHGLGHETRRFRAQRRAHRRCAPCTSSRACARWTPPPTWTR